MDCYAYKHIPKWLVDTDPRGDRLNVFWTARCGAVFDIDKLAINSYLYKVSITPTTAFYILILCALYGAGSNILINTFPILFISVLGCLYLHLVKKSDTSQRYTIHVAAPQVGFPRNGGIPFFSHATSIICVLAAQFIVWQHGRGLWL